MERRCFNSLISFLTIALVWLNWPGQALADSAMLEFETQALDLDTGTVTEQAPDVLDGTEGADFQIAYNADRIPHAVVIAVECVTLVFISGVSYDSVTAADVSGLSF